MISRWVSAASQGLMSMLAAYLYQLFAEFAQQLHGNLLAVDVAPRPALGGHDPADLTFVGTVEVPVRRATWRPVISAPSRRSP